MESHTVAFCVWLLSPSIMFPGFVHTVASASTSLLFMAERYSTLWMDHISVSAFIHQWARRLCLPVGCCESYCHEHHIQAFVWTCVPDVAESDWGGYLGTCQVRVRGKGLSISAFHLPCLPTRSFPGAGAALTSPPKATWTPHILARLWGRLFPMC